MSEQNVSTGTSQDPLIGRQLGDYRITSRLASGGMARIYKGMDYKLQRPAAVKVVELHAADQDQSITARFKREARAVAALEHPNIIPIYQYGEDDDAGVYFLAMKLVKGRDLSHELRRLRKSSQPLMDVERALNLMDQIAAALDYAHSQNIIHRDVKPSNILIDREDHATLTDLGLVLRVSAETTMGTAFGTPRYIAPEQATSSDKAVPQSDIYSFAVILYEILTGQTPFNGDSPIEIALAHIGDPVPPPRSINPAIPEAVEKELLKALDKEPSRRHASTAAFMEAVRRGYAKSPSENHAKSAALIAVPKPVVMPTRTDQTLSAPPSAQQMEPSRRRPSPMWFLMGLLVLVVGAFIVNGLSGGGGADAAGSAPVTLIYDDSTFTIINEGDYTLNVQSLKFVRGVDDNVDDFSGDRIPRDILPPDRNCFQIILGNGTPTIPAQCSPISEHRQGQETLVDPRRVPWRSEAEGTARIKSFEVWYQGKMITRCDTVERGGNDECRFNWPELPPSGE